LPTMIENGLMLNPGQTFTIGYQRTLLALNSNLYEQK
jgi:hypothetical protein